MTEIKPTRLWMAIKNYKQLGMKSDFDLRPIQIYQAPALARLMDASYRETIDYEGESLQQCEDEMRATINGKYGPFVQEASYVIYQDNKAVSACLITIWKEHPLIAFIMTDPNYQGNGFAQVTILKAIDQLANFSYKNLYLVVTNGNKAAQNLYRKIGFAELGEALPKMPPPSF